MGMRLVVLVSLLAAVSGSPMNAKPAEQQYLALYPARDEDEGLNSMRSPHPPHVTTSNIIFDPNTMPRPDPWAKMPPGPDRVFVPHFGIDDEKDVGPMHVTRRNMVVPDMWRVDKNPDLRPASVPAPLLRVTGNDVTDMPLSPSTDVGSECTDEQSVLKIGTTPEFSKSAIMPTRDARGTGPEVNSYKDFISGMIIDPPKNVKASAAIVVVASPHADDNLNPPAIEFPPEAALVMAYKFAGTMTFYAGSDFTENFDTRFDHMFREALALGAKVPVGNVEVTEAKKFNTISFEIGAPTLAAVPLEQDQLRAYIQEGDFMNALRLRGFPSATIGSVVLGDGNYEANMPEASLAEQAGPPGGKEDDALTIEEMRERLRAREAMTYGDYIRPGRLNLTNLSPHLFGDVKTSQSSSLDKYYVVGRIKFFLLDEDGRFGVLYGPVVTRVLSEIAGVPINGLTVSVNGKQQSKLMAQFHSLLQSDTLDAYVLVDFEIPAAGLELARKIQTAIVASMSDYTLGFRYHLGVTQLFPKNTDYTLLFIEIHGPNGMLVDDCEENESDDDNEDENSLEGRIGKLAATGSKGVVVVDNVKVVNGRIAPASMAIPDCESRDLTVPPDTSVEIKPPPGNSNDTWPAMTLVTQAAPLMNIPGRDGRDAINPSAAVQIDAATQDAALTDVHVVPEVVPEEAKEIPAQVAPAEAVHIEVAPVVPEAKKMEVRDVVLNDGVVAAHRGHAVQSDAPAMVQERAELVEPVHLSQLELRLNTMKSMEKSMLRELVEDEDEKPTPSMSSSNEMPEAADDNAPAGGFPVPDGDEGAL